jgi:RNA polymerase sigma-70 factor (ECF subfamily)
VTTCDRPSSEAVSLREAPALSHLVEKHLGQLRRYVRRRASPFVRSKEPVSDIVQSVLREACAKPEVGHAGEASFRAWLYTVAAHKIISKQRHHAAAERSLGREEPISGSALDHGGDDRSPSSHAEREEELERLRAALDELDPEDREVVVLRRIFDLPASEIARRNGEAESTVRWRLRRAMLRLADRLG